jgi:hypothetical protein
MIESWDEEQKAEFAQQVDEEDSFLYDYVNTELMPMMFSEWNKEAPVSRAIMNTVDWDELKEEIMKDNELDEYIGQLAEVEEQ